MSRNDDNFSKGFILGSIVGAGLFFLLGTEKGKKTQRAFKKRGEELVDTLSGVSEKAQREGERVKKELSKRADKVRKEISEKIEEVEEKAREGASEGVDKALKGLEEAVKKGRDAQSKYFKKDGKPLS